jgi:hypothetical protein
VLQRYGFLCNGPEFPRKNSILFLLAYIQGATGWKSAVTFDLGDWKQIDSNSRLSVMSSSLFQNASLRRQCLDELFC